LEVVVDPEKEMPVVFLVAAEAVALDIVITLLLFPVFRMQ
jgi:hypothetical protein